MRAFIVFLFIAYTQVLCPEILFAKFEFKQEILTKQKLESLVDIKKVRENTESYRVRHEVAFELDKRTVTRHVTSIWYFTTPADVQTLGQNSVSFDEETQKVRLINAATVLPDNSIYHLTSDDTKQIDSNSYDVFSSWQEILFNFSKLEAGGLTVLEYEVKTDKSKMESDWSTTEFPQIFYKTGKYKLSANWDPSSEPNIKVLSDIIQCTKNQGSFVCDADEIPAAIFDNNIYSSDVLGQIELGDFRSWDDVISLSMQKFDSAYSKTPHYLKKFLIAELGKNYKKEDALDFIHQYVARNIRYLSKSEYGHAITPHQTQKTLDKKMGDCKDKTALFIDLARQAGIDAYPVLVSTTKQKIKDDLVPTLNKFNHVIACYQHEEAEFCSDLTDAETNWKNTASWVQGKFSLRVLKGSTPEPLMKDKYRKRYDVHTEILVKKNGGQDEKQIRTYGNIYSAYLRGKANGKTEDEQKRWLTDVYQTVVSNQTSPTFTVTGLDTMNKNVVIRSDAVFEPFLEPSEDLNYTESDVWLAREVKNSYPLNKFYDETISGALISSRYIFDFQSLWQVTTKPADIKLEHRYGTLHRTSSVDSNGRLLVETTLRLPNTHLAKKELAPYSKFLDALKTELTIRIFGKKIIQK